MALVFLIKMRREPLKVSVFFLMICLHMESGVHIIAALNLS